MNSEEIKTVLILGSGTMGQQIGLITALHGFEVVLYDIRNDFLKSALTHMQKRVRKLVERNRFTEEQARSAFARIRMTSDPQKAAVGVDLISESVPEDPELKGKVFAQFNELCRPETVFTTNTSSLLPSQFAAATGRPDRFCALHFHDVNATQIVDVMPHPGTSPDTISLVENFAKKIGQIPIVLGKEHNGYVYNNMLTALFDSAMLLVINGVVDFQEVDRAWMGVMLSPIGPFGMMDRIGLDTVWKINDYWKNHPSRPNARKIAEFARSFVDKGKLGIKSGEGFYQYPNPEFLRPNFIAHKK